MGLLSETLGSFPQGNGTMTLKDEVWIGPTVGAVDDADAPPMVRGYRLTTALLHAFGHKTGADISMDQFERGEFTTYENVEALIAELGLEAGSSSVGEGDE
jgi:hypothetical protein